MKKPHSRIILIISLWLSFVTIASASEDIIFDSCITSRLKNISIQSVNRHGDLLASDGKRFKLADIHLINGDENLPGKASLAFIRQLVSTRPIRVFTVSSVDRYGLVPVYLFQGENLSTQGWMQNNLIAEGHAVFMPEPDPARRSARKCSLKTPRQDLRATDKKLLQNSRKNKKAKQLYYDAGDRRLWDKEGYFAIVEGLVVSVRTTGRGGTINFGHDWKEDFTAVISKKMLSSLNTENILLSYFVGRRLQLRGFLDLYFGPSMRIDHLTQMETLDE